MVDIRINEIIAHPDYRQAKLYNDIGLLRLERTVTLNGAIRPACLPEQASVPTKRAIVTGWGKVHWNGEQSTVLLKVILDMFSQDECKTKFPPNRNMNQGFSEESQLCAGSHTEQKDSCHGDSGG